MLLKTKMKAKRRRERGGGVGAYTLSKATDNFDFLVYLPQNNAIIL